MVVCDLHVSLLWPVFPKDGWFEEPWIGEQKNMYGLGQNIFFSGLSLSSHHAGLLYPGSSHPLTSFVQHCAKNYLTSENPAVRMEAIKTCFQLLLPNHPVSCFPLLPVVSPFIVGKCLISSERHIKMKLKTQYLQKKWRTLFDSQRKENFTYLLVTSVQHSICAVMGTATEELCHLLSLCLQVPYPGAPYHNLQMSATTTQHVCDILSKLLNVGITDAGRSTLCVHYWCRSICVQLLPWSWCILCLSCGICLSVWIFSSEMYNEVTDHSSFTCSCVLRSLALWILPLRPAWMQCDIVLLSLNHGYLWITNAFC